MPTELTSLLVPLQSEPGMASLHGRLYEGWRVVKKELCLGRKWNLSGANAREGASRPPNSSQSHPGLRRTSQWGAARCLTIGSRFDAGDFAAGKVGMTPRH
jgi:hypothetical protein